MTFEFDPKKSSDEHFAEFRKHLEGLDPECAKIFFDNQGRLSDGALTRPNRIAFNEAVLERANFMGCACLKYHSMRESAQVTGPGAIIRITTARSSRPNKPNRRT